MQTKETQLALSFQPQIPADEPLPKVSIMIGARCAENPGAGGWGASLRFHGKNADYIKDLWGFDPNTTNNRMELMAAIRAIESLKRTCEVTVQTPSQYVQKGISEWLPRWRAAGRLQSGDLQNADLWIRLDAAARRHVVIWQWVRSASGWAPGVLAANAVRDQRGGEHVATFGRSGEMH